MLEKYEVLHQKHIYHSLLSFQWLLYIHTAVQWSLLLSLTLMTRCLVQPHYDHPGTNKQTLSHIWKIM